MEGESSKNIGTFAIKNILVTIYDDSDSNWKGTVTWLSEGKAEEFSSTIHMLRLIDQAVTGMAQDDRMLWDSVTWIDE